MLRDFKIFRRHSGKNSLPEANENLPADTTDGSSNVMGPDPARAPLNTIQEPAQNAKSVSGQELGQKGKIDRTPSRMKRKGGPDGAPLPFPTPERLAVGAFAAASRCRLKKNESGGVEVQEETRSDGVPEPTHLLPPGRGGGNGNGGFPSMTPRVVRNGGKVSSNHSESGSVWSTQSTPTKSVTKPPNPAFAHSNGSRPLSLGARAANFAALSKGISMTSVPLTVVNSVEVPYFELKEDPSFWLDHNVQVLIRVRPLNSTERNSYGYNRCVKQESAQSITWIGQPETRFTFDHVACETVNQEMLFRVAGLPMVENCLSGYNSCMFAYGQTGSGKTYTMLGEIDDVEVRPSLDRGMTPRIFEFLFARIRAEEESRQDEKLKYNCKCSFLEIYNEQITDLLDPSSTNLLIREDTREGVYVENLTEIEVETVGDILKLLIQGAANRKVAATNMNRESSRSHCVFTCVIESRWEKDSTINLRFARLNLVDLAGSERQKASGAEGERLKEAANINKSLSTLGHVIMLLVDVAQGKQRHIPYRDSRLTFLLQDSLGGNSKTMIIANVSPSICCAAETLSTLKFAQRAKLIQNNAVVNEDASGDVIALQNQIRVLKEELALLKHPNVSRSLSFRSPTFGNSDNDEHDAVPKGKIPKIDHGDADESHGCESFRVVRVSMKQLKSLETTLAGALRREQMADGAVKQLEAEIEQLNRLVRQREEDTRCTKMMLKFREDKIHRMKLLLDGLIPTDSYLLEENNSLTEEIQLLRAQIDKNPEVTRFALENIRLLDQLRRFQDFYEEGEREMLLAEVSELRDQLVQVLDGNYGKDKLLNLRMVAEGQEISHVSSIEDPKEGLLQLELKNTRVELEECRKNLNFCMELNGKLAGEIDDLQSQLNNLKSACCDQVPTVDSQKGLPSAKDKTSEPCSVADQKKTADWTHDMLTHDEDILKLQLELDIVKSILEEERISCGQIEARALHDAEVAKQRYIQISKECEHAQNELMDARSVIEALESQQCLSITEIEEIRESNERYMELLRTQEEEIFILKKQLAANLEGKGKMNSVHQELRDLSFKHPENEDSPLQARMKRMQDSLEKAKMLNMRYQNDQAYQATHEKEMDEVRMQVEAETAEVIVCLQEELAALQQQVTDGKTKESEMKYSQMILENESRELKERIKLITQDNERLNELLEKKDEELRTSSEEWERLACEIAEILCNGYEALEDASDQVNFISESFPQRRSWIGEQVERMVRTIYEKDILIAELQKCLADAQNLRSDMELKLRSLRGATLAITEAQQQESSEKEKEVLLLTSQLNAKLSVIMDLEEQIKLAEDQNKKADVRATVAFMIVSRLAEINSMHLEALKHKEFQLTESVEMNMQKDALLQEQDNVIADAERQIEALRAQLKGCEESATELKVKLIEEKEHVRAMEQQLEKFERDSAESKVTDDLLEVKEKINEFKMGVHTLNSCMNEYAGEVGTPGKMRTPEKNAASHMENGDSLCREIEMTQGSCGTELNDNRSNMEDGTERSMDGCLHEYSFKVGKRFSVGTRWKMKECQCGHEEFRKNVTPEDVTILLLRKELESALDSLRGVQIQMNKLVDEKEEVKKSEKQSRESIKILTGQVLRLEMEMIDMEKQFESRLSELNHKLKEMGEIVKEADSYISEVKEVLELELNEAKVLAAQKVAEASSILAKFEEAQETMKEANDMVNALVAANETSKLEIERLKKVEFSLVNEVQSLQSSKVLKEQQYEHLEKQFHLTQEEARNIVQGLEDILSQLQTSFVEEFKPILSDIHSLKSQLVQSANLTRTWLEDIWSDIIVKDCAVSVLHLCHIGILLETVTGLNAENSLLHHGLCESNSIIADLKKHNFRAKRELEMCSILKGKLLVDIKNSFHRITRKEDETGKLSSKLNSFEKKIMDLQLQEESMLARSNSMGSELALLMKELDMNNRNAVSALLDQEKLLNERDLISKELDLLIDVLSKSDKIPCCLQAGNIEQEEGIGNYMDPITSQTELIMIDLFAKDIQLLILTSELEQKSMELQHMSVKTVNYEQEQDKLSTLLENVKEEMISVKVEKNLKKHILKEMKVEIALLKEEVEAVHQQLDLAQGVRHDLLLKLKQSRERNAELLNEKEALEREIQSLKEISDKQLSDLSNQSAQLKRLQDLHDEVGFLQDVISRHQNSLDEKSRELTEVKRSYDIALKEIESKGQDMKIQIEQMNVVLNQNKALKSEVSEVTKAREDLSAQIEVLKIETERLSEDLQEKETALGHTSGRISILNLENQKLQDQVSLLQGSVSGLETELDLKTAELTEVHHFNSIALDNFESEKLEDVNLRGKIDALEVENQELKSEVENIKAEHCRILEDLQKKILELESCSSSMSVFDQENHKLQESICSLEARIASLQRVLDIKDAELKEVCSSHSMIVKELEIRTQEIEMQINLVNSLKAENSSLRTDLIFSNQKKDEILTLMDLNRKRLFVSLQDVDLIEKKVFQVLDGKCTSLLDVMFKQPSEVEEMASNFVTESEYLETYADELISENSSLQAELARKDEVLKGLLFDLSLLQESASNVKDQKDEIEKVASVLESLEDELTLKSNELDEAVAHGQMLEAQLLEKDERISALELELSKGQKSLKLFSDENLQLKAHLDDFLVAKNSIEDDFVEKCQITDRLEEELIEMSASLEKMNCYVEGLKDDLNKVTTERDCLDSELLVLKEQLEMTRALAEENEAIATEARQVAESRRSYAEDKEEEVKLLERSVEELERTINALENKVEIIKREAERQRLQREDLEMELETLKHQMSAHSSGANMNLDMLNVARGVNEDLQRNIEEKLMDFDEAQKKVQSLEKDVAEKDAEIAKCKAHIAELNMHAEAQACEYKQKFKALEAMAQQVKPELASSNTMNSTAKMEKNASKSRGSGSPFKCIGLGLTHQINSEKEEELTAGRHRIEELEALAASRQKEIFMLNARLAAAESMTHDVIRDLLGVKLDMTNYASLLDHQQVQKITERARIHSEEAQEKGQEVAKLKQQLNEFIEERQGWLDEINRRHAEMVAAQIALEKLRQQGHFLTTENEMLKMDNANHKKKVMELEDEVKKLSGQQNLQQRIHHHAKIKEENNSLRTQNEDLSAKLRRTETFLLRVKEELAHYRASNGKSPYIDIDEEQRLKRKLEDTEEERVQLAQKLLNLCTSILKAAGITRPMSEISPSVAEEALNQLKDRAASMERELQDWKFKSKISSEKIRLSELRQQSSPLSSRPDEKCATPRRMSRTSPLSSLR